MTRLLALLAWLFVTAAGAQNISSMDPTQVYTTNNLTTFNQNGSQTTSAWQNVGQWGGQLTCWAPGGAGYCGPNPYVNANGQGMINFSYGYTDLYQVVNIAAALPNSGTGLRVNGYNFGFTAKNGNGWDGGAQDSLSAYVSFYSSNGNLLRNDYYNLNYTFDWTTFNFSKTFESPYAAKDLSTARYGFVGYDTNYWAGPYGPEIYNVSFSLNYSVDPCATNVLYSPTCPGYMDALAKLQTTTVVEDPAVTVSTNSTSSASTGLAAPTSSTSTEQKTTTASTTSGSEQKSTSTSTGTSEVAVTKEIVKTAATKDTAASTSAVSTALSIISKNRERDAALAAQAIQNSSRIADAAAQDSQKEAERTALQSQEASVSSSLTNNGGSANFNSTGLKVNTSPGLQLTLDPAAREPGAVNSGLAVAAPAATAPESRSAAPMQVRESITGVLSQTLDSNPAAAQISFTDPTNVINRSLEQPLTTPVAALSTGPTVNTRAANNEAAGTVDINRMALLPQGYVSYLNLTLRDAAFYAPREVYQNQRNVDNARALRQLTNDGRHREMVEQQYAK